MAALQSRASARPSHQPPHIEEQPVVVSSSSSTAARNRSGAPHNRHHGSSGGVKEAWVLFAPKRPPRLLSRPAPIVPTQNERSDDPPVPSTSSCHSWDLVKTDGSTEDIRQEELVSASSSASSPPLGDAEWSNSLPKHSDSRFFEDDEVDEDDELFTSHLADKIPSTAQRVAVTNSRPSTANTAGAESEDILSLPSSLSVSSRESGSGSPSSSLSPRRRLVDLQGHLALPRIPSAGTLTAAALSQIDKEDPLEPCEAGLTSGSDDGSEDSYEAILARAPDAISAGVKPVRRKALTAMPVNPQTTSVTSSKRRHRQAGLSDKGSKRSNQGDTVGKPVTARRASRRQGRKLEKQAYRSMMQDMFDGDDEVLTLMSQPGSVMSQARPSFASHIAFESGNSPFSYYSRCDDAVSDTETEMETGATRRDTHTESLGLHRTTFSLAFLQQYIVDSVYGALVPEGNSYLQRVLRTITV